MPDVLSIVVRDLAMLATSDRRAILAALDRGDRDRLTAAMRGEAVTIADGGEVGGEGRHSLWLADRIAAAQVNGDGTMTTAAGAALLDAVGASRGAAPQGNGRSLLQAASGLLGQGRAR